MSLTIKHGQVGGNTSMPSTVTQFISVGGTACLIFSVLYDFAYFGIVDRGFFSALSLGDHLTSALDRIPLSLGVFIVGILFSIFLTPTKVPEGTDLGAKGMPVLFENNAVGIVINRWHWITVIFVFFVGLLGFVFSPFPYSALLVVVFILWNNFSSLVTFRLRRWGGGKIAPYFHFSGMFAILALFLGVQNGYSDLAKTKGEFSIWLSNNTQLSDVIILKQGQFGTILRVPASNLNMQLRWDQIRYIEKITPVERRSNGCRWFGTFCPQ